MIRITKMADYGVAILSCFVLEARNGILTAAEAAQWTRLPAPMVSKILKALARAGLVESRRGARGGYSLARPLDSISAADVIAALDGPIAITECLNEDGDGCMARLFCRNRGNWAQVNRAIRQALGDISLTEMLAGRSAALNPNRQET